MNAATDLVALDVDRIVLDPNTEAPIVVLRGKDGETEIALPIWIGPFEAFSIALALEGKAAPRPMTHDLFHTVVERLGARVDRAVIRSIEGETFHATLILLRGEERFEIDARPSDAIALAVRGKAGIFATREILAASVRSLDFLEKGQEERQRATLESLDPKDFSKYKM